MDIQAFIDRVHQLFLDSEHEQALEDVDLFLSENSHTLRKKDLALILRLNGRAYERILNFEYALKHYSQALAIFQKIGLQDEIIKTMMRIGWVYMFKQGNLPKSLKYYNVILELVEGRHTFFHAEVLLFIGNILTEQGKMDQAGRYLTDSLKLCEEGRARG
ncbi:MAG: tetratricopeptide repeat protein, partial [Candidatus Heimdallarchaeota archaeon]|nr:tetratricopeptide repeat protein [Candidatus Heimdallarchaeota archaeon]